VSSFIQAYRSGEWAGAAVRAVLFALRVMLTGVFYSKCLVICARDDDYIYILVSIIELHPVLWKMKCVEPVSTNVWNVMGKRSAARGKKFGTFGT
jgi:hypothetical protein